MVGWILGTQFRSSDWRLAKLIIGVIEELLADDEGMESHLLAKLVAAVGRGGVALADQ